MNPLQDSCFPRRRWPPKSWSSTDTPIPKKGSLYSYHLPGLRFCFRFLSEKFSLTRTHTHRPMFTFSARPYLLKRRDRSPSNCIILKIRHNDVITTSCVCLCDNFGNQCGWHPFNQVDKAGATVLFEDANKKANNVGVVVSPTRISSLGEFGTPQFVADKLIQTERRKESTKEAEVISVSERSGHAGLQVYEFEYKVDSTRGGLKRVFSAAFVTSKKLYLLNITHSDGLENPLDMERRMILEQILHSFDAIPSS